MGKIKDKFNRKTARFLPLLAIPLAAAACGGGKPADVVSHNLSNKADNFQIAREIDVVDTITDEHIMSIRGLCSLGNDDPDYRLSVTCKVGEDKLGNGEYIKDFVYTPQTVTVLVQQLGSANVSSSHYSVTWNPGVLIPDFNGAGGKPLTPDTKTATFTPPSKTTSKTKTATSSASPKVKVVPLPGPTVTVQSSG